MVYRILDAWEFGLVDHWVNEGFYIPGTDKCFDNKPKKARDVPINLVDLTGAFLILGIGLGLAILNFLIELIVAKYRHEMKPMRAVRGKGKQCFKLNNNKKQIEPPAKITPKIEEELEDSIEVFELE